MPSFCYHWEIILAPSSHGVSAVPPVFKSRLRLRHLELFRNVCELHSLRKASDASNMTQPAATKLIQELEDMFGVPLFQRDRRGMRLTQHGELVRRHFDVVMADVGNMCADVNLFASGGRGVVRLGIIPSLSPALLAASINELLTAHPQVHLQLQEAATNDLMQELARNNLDIIFGRILHVQHAENLRVTKVYTESFDIVCAKGHPLASQTTLAWKELAQERWVLPATGTPLREMAENMFTAQGVLRPVVAVASSSFHHMRYLLASGHLVGVLPRSIAVQAEADGDLVRLRPHHRAKFSPISLIARKDLEQPPLIEEFERIVTRVARALNLG